MLNTSQFTGTENYYKSIVPGILYTDGAKYVADQCQAYWLLDLIATNQLDKKIRNEEFQVWKLVVDVEKNKGDLVCEDGNYNTVFKKHLSFTDFPEPEVTLWYENKVIYLPSER